MGFSQLKEKYQFLGDILNLYDKLDQPGGENDQNKEILILCDKAPLLKRDTGEYKKFCKKLLNNLLLLTKDDYGGNNFLKYCDILYMWMYFEIKKNDIPDDITKPIFDQSVMMIKKKLTKTTCPYFNFNEKINEPTKLINLHIFNNNVDTIQGLLKNSDKSKYCYLKKYVYECVNIYKEMNKTYNFLGNCNSSQHKYACDISNKFYTFYTSKIFNNREINHEFPQLSSDTALNDILDCPLEESEYDTGSNETQQGTFITQGVSTALSSMFTPVRNLFRFGNKKHTIITSDFDKKMENELFDVINKDSNIKDIQPKYNIGYKPI
ncbi:hypothetical protein PVMG_05342 [Plasmodium vivax Mauritania I]|uniref:VIR protein n=1 Tax=Plasmodium vivax Mauritania I TaxID=1035515 RepID=A0A0J9W5K0_PLAVI|nr:hypothetical protein PVMG_05342 [Plasmodium vivax Mauritania I]